MTIGELARRTGCGIETIRYYEHEGLLPKPGRTSGNFRRYGQEHAELLSFIRHCRSLDMALNEIRILLRFRSAPDEIVVRSTRFWIPTSVTWKSASQNCKAWRASLGRCGTNAAAGDRRSTVGFCRDLAAPPMTGTHPATIMFRVRIRPSDRVASS